MLHQLSKLHGARDQILLPRSLENPPIVTLSPLKGVVYGAPTGGQSTPIGTPYKNVAWNFSEVPLGHQCPGLPEVVQGGQGGLGGAAPRRSVF